jgi:endonuclease YncB( thermonuclease family)
MLTVARRSGLIYIVPLLLWFLPGRSFAAEKREWVTLANCRYLEAADNDGDSFRVRCGEREFVVRLYYVDAPETNLKQAERTHEQSLHFGITLDETMKIGVKAKDRVKELLQKPFVIRTRWAAAGGRGREPRYYVLIEIDDKLLAEVLVNEGLAQTKGIAVKLPTGEKASIYKAKLESLEAEAREKKLGAWAMSAAPKVETEPN